MGPLEHQQLVINAGQRGDVATARVNLLHKVAGKLYRRTDTVFLGVPEMQRVGAIDHPQAVAVKLDESCGWRWLVLKLVPGSGIRSRNELRVKLRLAVKVCVVLRVGIVKRRQRPVDYVVVWRSQAGQSIQNLAICLGSIDDNLNRSSANFCGQLKIRNSQYDPAGGGASREHGRGTWDARETAMHVVLVVYPFIADRVVVLPLGYAAAADELKRLNVFRKQMEVVFNDIDAVVHLDEASSKMQRRAKLSMSKRVNRLIHCQGQVRNAGLRRQARAGQQQLLEARHLERLVINLRHRRNQRHDVVCGRVSASHNVLRQGWPRC